MIARASRAVSIAAALLAIAIPAPRGAAAPAECIPVKSCDPPPLVDYPALAATYGTELRKEWVEEYAPMLLHRFEAACGRHARCLAVWGNSGGFCRDNLKNDLFAECERLFEGAPQSDVTSCRMFANVFSLGQEGATHGTWKKAQQCAQEAAAAAGHTTSRPQPRVEVEPAAPAPGTTTTVVVRAFDADGDPVMALVTLGGVERAFTFLPTRYSLQFRKSWDDEGRGTLHAPAIVVSPPPRPAGAPPPFEPVTIAFESKPLTVRLEVTPPVTKWKKGRNSFRVKAWDATTGAEVRGRVKTVGTILGSSGETLDVTLEPGTRPCGQPVWFVPELGWYEEADLGVPRCPGR